MNNSYNDLEPREVWRHFDALNTIPRPSGEEEKAREYVRQLAKQYGATTQEDAAGNIVVRVAGNRVAANNASTHIVAIQSHLDMVCEKRPDVQHDFSRDPIIPRRDGDKIYATGTTLGADNGIGAAMSLAVLTSEIEHGPLELLFTVEEETGLYGAMKLDESLLQADYLINLDSEDPDEITIGCAGGAGTTLHLPLQTETVESHEFYKVVVSGLQGGHSGIQINEPLANAVKVLLQVLDALPAGFRIASIHGGNAHNAIPRDATAVIALASTQQSKVQDTIAKISEQLQTQWQTGEPQLQIELHETTSQKTMTPDSAQLFLQLLRDAPHGVLKMSQTFAGKVETSANLATVQTRESTAEIHVSVRSFIADELDAVQENIRVLGEKAGAKIEVRDGYPGWEPKAESALLTQAQRVYSEIYGESPKIEVVHAGLECGAIVDKKPALEAISFGPLIRGPHTPEEWVSVSSVGQSWNFLTRLLAQI